MKTEIHFNMIKLLSRTLFCGLLYAGQLQIVVAEEVLLDQIAAVVENDVITENELLERLNVIYSQADSQTSLPPRDVLIDQVLQRMIIERLQVQRAERLGISVDNLSLDQAMRNLASRNGLSLEGFRDALLRQGINYEDFREQVKSEMIIGQLRNRVVDATVEINESEINELLASQQNQLNQNAEYHISHILISLPEAPTAEDIAKAKATAEELRSKALAGADFEQLALSHSDAGDALDGGDLGWRQRGQVPGVFVRELNGMEPGDISNIIRSASGFHLFLLRDIRGTTQQMVEQVRARHILIRTNALMTDADAERQLNQLRNRILNGEDFAELAKAHSEDPASAVEGGDLGWLTPDTFVPAFRDVVDRLPAGEVSRPFKSRFGWHIVEVLGRRDHDNAKQAMRQQAREFIRQRKIEEETEIWLRELRDESYIEIRLPNTNES